VQSAGVCWQGVLTPFDRLDGYERRIQNDPAQADDGAASTSGKRNCRDKQSLWYSWPLVRVCMVRQLRRSLCLRNWPRRLPSVVLHALSMSDAGQRCQASMVRRPLGTPAPELALPARLLRSRPRCGARVPEHRRAAGGDQGHARAHAAAAGRRAAVARARRAAPGRGLLAPGRVPAAVRPDVRSPIPPLFGETRAPPRVRACTLARRPSCEVPMEVIVIQVAARLLSAWAAGLQGAASACDLLIRYAGRVWARQAAAAEAPARRAAARAAQGPAAERHRDCAVRCGPGGGGARARGVRGGGPPPPPPPPSPPVCAR